MNALQRWSLLCTQAIEHCDFPGSPEMDINGRLANRCSVCHVYNKYTENIYRDIQSPTAEKSRVVQRAADQHEREDGQQVDDEPEKVNKTFPATHTGANRRRFEISRCSFSNKIHRFAIGQN